MIQNIIFDLDGVLFDGCDFHANTFIKAVNLVRPDIGMTREYHDLHLNALSTRSKLKRLGIDTETLERIYVIKQALTKETIGDYIKPDKKVQDICTELKERKYRLFCVSNSIRETVEACLSGMGVIHNFTGIISNQDTTEAKPSPEPYLTLYRNYNLDPRECLIIEDSPYGIESATKSGGNILPVKNCDDVTLESILTSIKIYERNSNGKIE
jgi:HAD superfamily hydrolase (TIGR01509 family)